MILLLHELKHDLCKIIALPKIEIFLIEILLYILPNS